MPLVASNKEELIRLITNSTTVHLNMDLYRSRNPVSNEDLIPVLRLLNANTVAELTAYDRDRRETALKNHIKRLNIISKTLPRSTDVQEVNRAIKAEIITNCYKTQRINWKARGTDHTLLSWTDIISSEESKIDQIVPTESREELLNVYDAPLTRTVNVLILNDYNCGAASLVCFEKMVEENQLEKITQYTIPMTQHANHRIKVYKVIAIPEIEDIQDIYVFVTNTYNTQLVYQAAAIALPAVCTQVPDEIKPLVTIAHEHLLKQLPGITTVLRDWLYNYYAEYVANMEEIQRLEEIKKLMENMDAISKRTLQDKIDALKQTIEAEYETLQAYYRELSQTQVEHLRLITNGMSEKFTELKNFLVMSGKTYQNLKFERDRSSLSYIKAIINTPLLYWDEGQYKLLRESARSNPVTRLNDKHKCYYDDILLRKDITLHMQSGVKITMSQDRPGISYWSDERNISNIARTGMSNPHHRYHNCFGNNVSPIHVAVRNNDFITILCQASAAVAGINMADGTVMSEFFDVDRDLAELNNSKILTINATKERISPREYFNRISSVQNKGIKAWLEQQNTTATTIELPVEDIGLFEIPTQQPTSADPF